MTNSLASEPYAVRDFFSAAAAFALRLLKTKRQLNSLLVYGAKTDRPTLVDACIRAGADIHVADDYALKGASYGGFVRTASSILKAFDPRRDAAALEQAAQDASLFGHTEVVNLIRAKLASACPVSVSTGPA